MSDKSQIPWIVFADRAEVRAAPVQDSDSVRTVSHGGMVFGTQLEIHPSTNEEWLKLDPEWYGGGGMYVSRSTVHRVHPSNQVEGDLPIGSEKVDRWWGLPLDYEPSDLVYIPVKYALRGREDYQLRREVAEALAVMLDAAREDGIDIRVTSAYRSGPRQRTIYLRNISRNGPGQRASAPPGHSEHQLGTTVDLTDPEGRHSFSQAFDKTPQGKWLEKNANRFGFRRSYYPDNVEETGYISEPWHWRYHGKPEDSEKE